MSDAFVVTNQNLVVFEATGSLVHSDGSISGGHAASGVNTHLPIFKRNNIEYVFFDGHTPTKVSDVKLQTSRETVTR